MTEINRPRIFLDTAPVIYYLERNPQYCTVLDRHFSMWYEKGADLMTSAVTVEEYCVFAYKSNNTVLEQNFFRFLHDFQVSVYNIDIGTAKEAAKLRAKYRGFKVMDAMQLASSIEYYSDIFLTNDTQLRQCAEQKVVLVSDL